MTKLLYVTDTHAHPDYNNDRADWLGRLIFDIKPDVVVHGGDSADMPSLSSYDKGKRSYAGASYRKDIDTHLDFQERMWAPFKRAKKRMPYNIFFVGNHEQRIDRALDLSPELVGTISYDDLKLKDWYDEVHHYDGSTPASRDVLGVNFQHYAVTGVSNLPVSGINIARSLINKYHGSMVVGHNHTLSYEVQNTPTGLVQGLCGGCYMDYDAPWAGQANRLWWRGVTLMDFQEDFHHGYDPTFISLNQIKRDYSCTS